ncbi:hypothetical protein OKW37_003644 [Paraburkholderia sp. MM5482-R2]
MDTPDSVDPAGAGKRHGRASCAARAETQARMTLGLDVCASVVDRLLNGGDLLGFFIWNFHAEFVFEGHHEFNGVERVGAEIVHERRFVLDFRFRNAQLFRDDLLDALFDIVHYPSKGKEVQKYRCAHFIRFDPAKKRRIGFLSTHAPRDFRKRIKARIVTEIGYCIYMPPFTCSVVPVM